MADSMGRVLVGEELDVSRLRLETMREYSADMDNRQLICEIMGLIKSSPLVLHTRYKDLGTPY